MGMSVTAASAIVFIGMTVIFGIMFPAFNDSNDTIMDLKNKMHEEQMEQKNSELKVDNCTYNYTNGSLNIIASNEGEYTYDINSFDLMVNGKYVSSSDYNLYNKKSKNTSHLESGDQLIINTDHSKNVTSITILDGFGNTHYFDEVYMTGGVP